MVFLDVVYNHFGPEGNYLGRYAPAFFTDGADAVGQRDRLPRAGGARLRDRECAVLAARLSLRRAAARRRACHRRARRSLHAARSQPSRSASSPRETGRHIHLVLENDDNRASLLDPAQDPPRGKYRAQWNDDYHHAWHVLLTGETQGYYGDYAARRCEHIARALGSGFVYQGEASAHRDGQPRGEPSGAACRRPPSSTSCRTTTRSAIAPLGDRLETQLARRGASKRRWRSRCSRRCSRCCSWARNGARQRRSRSSATSRASSRRRCARAGARNSPGPMQNMATRFPIRWQRRHSDPRCWIGIRGQRQQRAERLALVRDLLAIAPARDRAAACGAPHSAKRMQRMTACCTANWRWATAQACAAGQPLGRSGDAAPTASKRVAADLGRRVPAT